MLSIRAHLTLTLLAQSGMFALGAILGIFIGGQILAAMGYSPNGDESALLWVFAVAGALPCSSD